jgi:hypothetical protein
MFVLFNPARAIPGRHLCFHFFLAGNFVVVAAAAVVANQSD